jgi:hypothetical protein
MSRTAVPTVQGNLSSAISKLAFASFTSMFAFICNLGSPPVLADDDSYSMRDTPWQTTTTGLVPPKVVEPFDKDKWQHWMGDRNVHPDLKLRLKEWTDFLESYPVIGMKREDITSLLGSPSENPKPTKEDAIIDYYQLDYAHSQNVPMFYLEFQYSNGRVCAFRTENIVPLYTGVPFGMEQFMREKRETTRL